VGEFAISDASNGQEAIDIVIACSENSRNQPFDLIIMDVDMPDMNGWQTTEKLLQL
jgi:CheY-like chemotaxis protein